MAYDQDIVRTLRRRWKSGDHVGAAKPVMRAYVRTVRIVRRARHVDPDDVYAHIPGWEGANTIWQGRWKPKNGWKLLPNVLGVEIDQDFDQNGVANATIEIDNIGTHARTGVAGIYHVIERGYYSPFRGSKPGIGIGIAGERNSWFDVLSDKSSQIIVLAGYGDAVVPIFEGLVNDADLTSRPDKITLTCRDGGQLLTDQHIYVNAKVRTIKDPITFCDRRQADNTTSVGYGADASDSSAPPRFVLDDNSDTAWVSADRDHDHPANLPWIEVSLPNGRYEEIELHPRYADMTAFVAIRARDKNAPGGQGARKHYLNDHYGDGDWIAEGVGNTVPGTSIPYVMKIESVKAKKRTIRLPDYGYDLGDNSKVRIYFTNLDRGRSSSGKNIVYRAGVIRLNAVRRRETQEAEKAKWILVDDLADVVRTVLQWCGINDWEVETTGVRLKQKATFNRGQFLIDIINAASDQVGYAFSMRPREFFDESEDALASEEEDMSMGIGVWRQTNAMHKGSGVRDAMETIHENETLQGINAKWTDEPLAYNIRIRGHEKKKKNGGRADNGDSILRVMYVYRPPWSADSDYRNANIKKYVVHHDEKLRTVADCKVAALFIAFREALEAGQAQLETPAMPTMFLDQQAALKDTGTGLSTRLYIASRQLSYRSGEAGHFKMALAGPLLDLKDVDRVRDQLVHVLRDNGYDPGLSQWEIEHWGKNYRNE